MPDQPTPKPPSSIAAAIQRVRDWMTMPEADYVAKYASGPAYSPSREYEKIRGLLRDTLAEAERVEAEREKLKAAFLRLTELYESEQDSELVPATHRPQWLREAIFIARGGAQ